ncbi:MAG TPA: cupin domain-containing protein [Mycobacteriales bacterium]|jgi:hypothetical protein|nr:cupin domain-containing protein [Mycobacteriales bacterium]
MPRTRKDEAPLMVDEEPVTGRYVELDDYTVSFETFHTEFDPAPLFRGLPDDRCQCAHWGVVVSGKLEMRYADRTEIYAAGDAYYAAPGHVPWPHTGTEVVEFSPTADLQATMQVVGANLAGASA